MSVDHNQNILSEHHPVVWHHSCVVALTSRIRCKIPSTTVCAVKCIVMAGDKCLCEERIPVDHGWMVSTSSFIQNLAALQRF